MIFENIGKTVRPWLLGLIEGDEDKSRLIFEWISPAIRANLFRRGFQSADVDDVSSKVYLKMIQSVRRPTYDMEKTRFRVVVGRCINDVIVDMIREKDRRLTTVPLIGDVEARQAWVEDYRVNVVNHALLSLRRQGYITEEELLAFAEIKEGKTHAEIAAKFGKDVDWAHKLKSRVLKMLREECKGYDQETNI